MENINEIGAALAKAQSEMSNPAFDAANPHFRNRFASLAAVRNAVVPVLSKHGISLHQDLRTDGDSIQCNLLLIHSSGQHLAFGPLTLPASKHDAQGFGSAATYARRYQMMAVCGVVGDADDDAESAVGRDGKMPEPKEPSTAAKLLASNFIAAVDLENDEQIAATQLEANKDHELFQEAWKLIDSARRRAIKSSLDRSGKLAKPMLANGRSA